MADGVTTLLLRVLIMIGCEPGSIGGFTFIASPTDPIFWVVHQTFEKAMHILQLSAGFLETYDFAWDGGTCFGSFLDDKLPFTGMSARCASLNEQRDGRGRWFGFFPATALATLLVSPDLEVFEGLTSGLMSQRRTPLPQCFHSGSSLTFASRKDLVLLADFHRILRIHAELCRTSFRRES